MTCNKDSRPYCISLPICCLMFSNFAENYVSIIGWGVMNIQFVLEPHFLLYQFSQGTSELGFTTLEGTNFSMVSVMVVLKLIDTNGSVA